MWANPPNDSSKQRIRKVVLSPPRGEIGPLFVFHEGIYPNSSHTKQLHIKNQSGISRDFGIAARTIAHIGRNDDFPTVAHVHTAERNLPTRDHFHQTKGCRHTVATCIIEHAAIDKASCIVDTYHTAHIGLTTIGRTRLQHTAKNALGEFHDTFLTGKFFQISLVAEFVV